jgi:CRP/FNR family transcriptional regulator, cyclic AMP receptor protein
VSRTDAELASVAEEMAKTPLFEGASPQRITGLVGRGAIRRYRRGTYLFHQGDESPDVLFLVEGRVEISSITANGHRQLHTTLDRPQFFGELGVLGDISRTAGAIALDESVVWVVRGEVFLEFLASDTHAARALLRALARQVVSHEAFVDDLLFLDLKGRVAKRLLQLVSPSLDDLPEDGAVLPSIVTHADLASLCGGSRENVTRILSDFQRRGFVERDGKRFVLRKISGLARLAGL